MLIWKGLGILVPLFVVLSLILAVPFTGDAAKYGLAFSQLVAAAAIWWTGRALNARPGRLLHDPQTGETVELKATHSFFFIKMEYWAVLVVSLGVAMLFA